MLQNRTTLVTFLLLLFLALISTIAMIQPYLMAVTMGGILALLSNAAYQKLLHRRVHTRIAALIVTVGVALLVIAPFFIVVNITIKQGIALAQSLTEHNGEPLKTLFNRISAWGPVHSLLGNPEVFERQTREWLQSGAKTLTTLILSLAADVPLLVLQLALTQIACFFFLVDGRRFLNWIDERIPLDSDVRVKIAGTFKNTAISSTWATFAAASAQTALTLISLLVLQVPAAVLGAGLTFVFAWIPMVGSTPVWIRR